MNEADKKFMRRAIELAQNGMDKAYGGPFGAVVVKEGKIIAEGWNTVTSSNDPTAHAEVNVIRKACQALEDFQLTGCTLYTSCEPCPMCLGAIYWARPERIVYACQREDAADIAFDDQFIYEELNVPMMDRRIPTDQLLREEAIAVFEAWKIKEGKTEY